MKIQSGCWEADPGRLCWGGKVIEATLSLSGVAYISTSHDDDCLVKCAEFWFHSVQFVVNQCLIIALNLLSTCCVLALASSARDWHLYAAI